MEHDWPDELTSDAQCARCGLEFGEWSEDYTKWCTLEQILGVVR